MKKENCTTCSDKYCAFNATVFNTLPMPESCDGHKPCKIVRLHCGKYFEDIYAPESLVDDEDYINGLIDDFTDRNPETVGVERLEILDDDRKLTNRPGNGGKEKIMEKALTTKEAEKDCRHEARIRGLTFKKEAGPVYSYVGRKSGKIYRSTDKIGTAFEIACSDELDLYKEV